MIQATIILILIILAYQDWQSREVSWLLLIILAGLFVWQNYMRSEWNWLSEAYKCGSFLLLNILGVSAYFSWKSKKMINIFKELFGLGDLLILLVFCIAFSFKFYMMFFLGGLLFAIAIHLILSRILKLSHDNIPLVTYFSIFYLTSFTFQVLFIENLNGLF